LTRTQQSVVPFQVRPQDLAIFNFLDEARPCCPFRSFANPDAESSRVLVILFGCFFERLNSRVDARHLSINISEPASPPTISISHSAVRSDSTLPSFRPAEMVHNIRYHCSSHLK
jgi:hypothetical protein